MTYKGIVPYLFVDNAEAALDWYASKFDFTEIGRWENENGKVQNAEMKVGDTEIWIDGGGSVKSTDDRPQWIGIWVDDVDAVYKRLNDNGVDCEPPVTREFGIRMLNVEDGMGYLWGFIKRVPVADG